VNNIIAERALVCVAASGECIPFTLRLGAPYHDPRGNWACPVALDGLEHSLSDIAGVDAWQSLMLAQRLALRLLSARAEKGARFVDALEGNAVTLQEFFAGGL